MEFQYGGVVNDGNAARRAQPVVESVAAGI
jgi:hypothetical protein